MESVEARASARVGLLGNPSDAFGGRALACTLPAFEASVRIEAAERFEIAPAEEDALTFPDLRQAVDAYRSFGSEGGNRLLRAAVVRFFEHAPACGDAPAPQLRFRMAWQTRIPRQVGLGGSSAIVVAALRALAAWFRVELAPLQLAELALAAEVEELGITAGPMDRVTQAYDDLVLVDCDEPFAPGSVRVVGAGLLPPLFVAWNPAGGRASGRVHASVRERFQHGDPVVRGVMRELAALADEGLACLERGDGAAFRACLDRNLALRCRVYEVDAHSLELAAIARDFGASAKLSGSGGAVVGSLAEAARLPALAVAYREADYACVALGGDRAPTGPCPGTHTWSRRGRRP
jgi:glucuronokinase